MRMKNRVCIVSFATLSMLLLLAGSSYADDAASGKDTAVLDLGKIQVHGQAEIVKALQAIKIALKAPESSDAKARNMIVCRIDTDIGTHHQQFLVCATNKSLDARRQSAQNAMLTNCPNFSCRSTEAFDANSPLGAAINATDDHVLRMPINGAALKALLVKLPDPTPEAQSPNSTAPEAGSVSATPVPNVSTAPPPPKKPSPFWI
jgi:hypothetical protein